MIMPSLKASTLVETLVAMILILLVFAFSAMTYSSVLRSNNSRRLDARLLLRRIASDTKKKNMLYDEIFSVDGFEIKKSVSHYKNMEDLQLIWIVAQGKDGNVVAESREVVGR